jgi:RNA polymerase sigma-70 factor (ECF subfamily)
VSGTGPAERAAVKRLAALPEAKLVALALTGDRDAWGVLIERHDHRVVVSLVARGIRLGAARELAHRTWIRLIDQQRAGRLTRLELPGLAVRQAGFLALDAARRRDPELADADAADDAEALADPNPDAELRLIRREELARAHTELARCPPAAREVFTLLYTNPGMSHAEAARRLGLSVQRVRQTLCEVRARLRLAIEAEPSDG